MSEAARPKHSILSVNIDDIDIYSLIDQKLENIRFAISGCIEERGLFEIIALVEIDSMFDEKSKHLY
jgi:ribonucleotide reductase alpha subunit